MVTLWNSFIQGLLTSEDVPSVRLGVALLGDNKAFTSWTYSSYRVDIFDLPKWPCGPSLGLILDDKDLDYYFLNFTQRERTAYLRLCKKKHDEKIKHLASIHSATSSNKRDK